MTIEAGEGYRLLEADETIREGDEGWVDGARVWMRSERIGQTCCGIYRRRVSTPVEVHTVPEGAHVTAPPAAERPPCPHRADTLDLIHQEVSHLRAKLATANYSAAEAEERARRAERDLTGLRGVHQAIGEALIRVWPSEPRDWVRKVEAIGGEMGALRREAQALRDQVRCVGPETCGECLACLSAELRTVKQERDAARAATRRGSPRRTVR